MGGRIWRDACVCLLLLACGDDAGGGDAPDAGASPDAQMGGTPGAGGVDGAGGDAAGGMPGGGGVMPDGMALDTPLDTWTWLPIEGARCADGSPTGVGVNRSGQSDDLVILMQGGGACWDGQTCFVIGSAVNVEGGHGAARFATDAGALQPDGARDAQNPLSLATQVFVPYCTGDLHAGTVEQDYTVAGQTRHVHHVGADNVDLLLDLLVAGLSKPPPTIWLLGSSAGGYGVTLNLQTVEARFPDAEVHALADSAPPLTPPDGRWSAWQAAWSPRLPPGCTDCATRFGAVIDAIATDPRHGRIGLLAYEQDATIAAFFGFDGPAELQALDDLLATSYGHADTRYFIASGTDHVMLGRPQTRSAQDDALLSEWLATWILGAPVWLNAR